MHGKAGSAGLTLASEVVEPFDETKHFKLIGTTGTGKSTAIRELLRLVVAAPVEELRTLLEASPAQPFVAESNERMFGSIRSVATSAVAALEYIEAQESAPSRCGNGSARVVACSFSRISRVRLRRSVV